MSGKSVVIRGGTVVDATGERRADVVVADGRIQAVGDGLADATADVVLDAGGCLVGPGLVDLHTHLRQPGREEAETVETGSRAAALGGYTAVVAMPNTEPAIDCAAVVREVLDLGATALCDVRVTGAIDAEEMLQWLSAVDKACVTPVVACPTLPEKPATAFAAAIVIADVVVFAPVSPEGINVAWPQSVLFYPAVAYVAEVVFHALPLMVQLVIMRPLFKKLEPPHLVWVSILLTSLLERRAMRTSHVEIEVDPVLHRLGLGNLLEAQTGTRPDDDYHGVGLRRQPLLRKPRDLGVVVRHDLVTLEGRRPEARERKIAPGHASKLSGA